MVKKNLEFKNSREFKIFVKESSILGTKPINRYKVYSITFTQSQQF